MDTLKSFLSSERFNGTKEHICTGLDGLVVDFKLLEKKQGFESQQLFFFLMGKDDEKMIKR